MKLIRSRRILPTLIMTGLIAGSLSACSGPSGESTSKLEDKINSGEVLATRNGVEIREGYVDLLKQVNPNIANQLKTPAGKKRLVDNLLEQESLYREAVKRGIPQKPEHQEKAALYERVIFAQGLIEEEIGKKAKAYYDENKDKEFSQVEVSHILLRTQAPRPNAKDAADKKGISDKEALQKGLAARKELGDGVAWEEVVTKYSDDRLTKGKGGDLGKLTKQDRRATRLEWQDLLDQAFKMKAGQISGPIKAKDGYHIIKVTEAAGIAPYAEVANRIKFKLRGPAKKEVLAEIAKGEIVYQDEELKQIATQKPGAPATLPASAHSHGAPVAKPAAKAEAQPKTKPAPPAAAPKKAPKPADKAAE